MTTSQSSSTDQLSVCLCVPVNGVCVAYFSYMHGCVGMPCGVILTSNGRVFATRRIDIADSFIHALPERHLAILQPRIGERQMALRKAIDVNFAFIKEILRSSKNIFENSSVSRDVSCLFVILFSEFLFQII